MRSSVQRAPDGKEWRLRVTGGGPRDGRGRAGHVEDERGARWRSSRRPAVTGAVRLRRDGDGSGRVRGLPAEVLADAAGRGDVRAPAATEASKEVGTEVHELLAGTAVGGVGRRRVRLAEVFRRSDAGTAGGAARRGVEREFDFVIAVEDVVVRGQIDLWFEEGGELVIVDYKTDAVNGVGGAPAGAGLCDAGAAVRDGGGAGRGPGAGSGVAAFSAAG